jgi:putative tricarboxylic transport membrane protein
MHNLLLGFEQISNWSAMFAIVGGVVLGIGVGVLPGLSASTGVALLLPITWFLEPVTALILLCALYTAAEYGGCITAIAINTPGEPSSMVTSFDGYPLTKQGRMSDALSVSLWTSVVGGIIGTIALITISPILANFAIRFGPAEYVGLGILGLTLAASLSSGDYVKGAVTTLLGLLLSTFGQDPITGATRFAFGVPQLIDGIALVPAMIGLFAASEVFGEFLTTDAELKKTPKQVMRRMPFSELWALRKVTLLSSVIGTVIGTIPGAGTTIASLIAYNEARRFSKNPDLFGKGSLEGVAASEAANNACVGGALVPMLTLGVPGSATTAVMLGALIMHGIQPGPGLFRTHADLLYGLFVALLVSNVVLLGVALAGVRVWLYIMRVPKPVLMSMIMCICVIGSFAGNNSLWDVGQMIAFGLLGFLLKKFHFPVSTVVLGLVLGFMVETNIRRAVMLGGWEIFPQSPLAMGMIFVAVASAAFVIFTAEQKKRKLALAA